MIDLPVVSPKGYVIYHPGLQLYSRGGNHTSTRSLFKKNAKIWKGLGPLKNHLNMYGCNENGYAISGFRVYDGTEEIYEISEKKLIMITKDYFDDLFKRRAIEEQERLLRYIRYKEEALKRETEKLLEMKNSIKRV